MGNDRHEKPGYATLIVTYNGEPIGEMHVPRGSPSMAMCVPFRPYAAYEQVRPLFRSFNEARTNDERRRFFAARDALDFAIIAQDGRPIPVPWVHIYDLSEEIHEVGGTEADAYGVEFEITAGWRAIVADDTYWTDGDPRWIWTESTNRM